MSEHAQPGGDDGGRSPEPQTEPLGFDLPPAARPSSGRVVVIGIGIAAVLAGAFAVGWLPRRRADKELIADTKAAAAGSLRVQVVAPTARSSDRAMNLPANVQALEEAVIYPRSSGYVRSWKADIGDIVKEGELLAEIDTPEIEQQLAQARAQLAQAEAGLLQAKASRTYSQTTLDRYKELAPKGVASHQELDKAESQSTVDQANVDVAIANVDAQKANIRRYAQLQSFSRITAPFTGKIISRQVERGALVSPTTALFKLSQSDTVRVFVQVPQDVAPSIVIDTPVKVTVREYAGRVFQGKIARSAGALDPASRTMNTEVRVPNEKHELISGMYAQVGLTLPSPHRVWELPAPAIMTSAKGVNVAIVEEGKIRMALVTVERDNGPTTEISHGVSDNDMIVKLGSAELYDGRAVEVVP